MDIATILDGGSSGNVIIERETREVIINDTAVTDGDAGNIGIDDTSE